MVPALPPPPGPGASPLPLAPSRRRVLQSLASGFGYLAFAGLAQQAAARDAAAASPAAATAGAAALAPRATHFPARAQRVIFLCMNGGPSHLDLFDHKPTLQERADSRSTTGPPLLPSPFRFAQHGQSGQWISELLPELSRHADELCIVNSMHTDLPNHSQAFLQMHTGSFQFTRPSLGAWCLYGLGTENTDLPGFVTINPPSDNGGARNYGSGFLPAIYQGTKIGANQIPGFYAALLGVDSEPGPPLKNIDSRRLSLAEQRAQLDLIRDLNRHRLAEDPHHGAIEAAIESFELAFRMQGKLPELMDLADEPASLLQQYGVGPGRPTDRFARQCLMARRLAEAGVRFIEITAPVGWDHHFRLKETLAESCAATDRPIAALLADLKQRGMLEQTLVIWAGEFGRTPYAQSGTGRDHNNQGYTLWMAGGGVRGGTRYGATDELGAKAVDRPVHLHDWHATLLHLLGLDHQQLTFNHAGRDFRLTDVYGNVVRDLIG